MDIHDKNIAILYGGWSDERDISLDSGKSVYEALQKDGLNVFLFDFDRDDPEILEKFIIKNKVDLVFNLMHGVGGEDGHVQKYLEKLPVQFIGSDSESSYKSFNKILTKDLWASNNLLTPKYHIVKPDMFEHITIKNFSDKIVLKPIKSGSSVGIKILNLQDFITTNSDLSYKKLCESMVDDIAPHDYFIEQYIDHAEYTAPIISNKVFPIIKIDTEREFYNYNAKYIDNNTSFTFPKFPASVQEKINNTALDAFALLGCSTWGRIDFFMNHNFEINLIEINSIPGMTSHSLVPMSAKHSGLNYIDLIKLLLEN